MSRTIVIEYLSLTFNRLQLSRKFRLPPARDVRATLPFKSTTYDALLDILLPKDDASCDSHFQFLSPSTVRAHPSFEKLLQS